MAADSDNKPGVLGNLPRSRPGQRSAKRTSGSAARKPQASKSSAKSAPRSARTTPKRSASTASSPPTRARSAPPARPARKEANDPLGQAVELAGKVAAVGLKTAAGIVKRLPRP